MSEPTPSAHNPFAHPHVYDDAPGAQPAPDPFAGASSGSPPATQQWAQPEQWGGPPPAWDAPPQLGWGAPPPAGWGAPPQPGWAPYPRFAEVVPSSALASPGLRLGAALLNGVLFLLTLGVGYLVWALVLWGRGTNPGKSICGLVTVKADTGQVCNWGQMCLRNFVFGYVIMSVAGAFTLYIANVVDHCMVFGERRQRLIDKMANTLIVKR